MAKIISIHSFRRGTGKSLVATNVAALLAAEGQRVGVIDANLIAPSLHILFNLEDQTTRFLNDYLAGSCGIAQTVHDVTENLGMDVAGRVFLIPADTDMNRTSHILHEGYDENLFGQGFVDLDKALKLDTIVVDHCAGLNEEIITSIALADAAVIIMRPDKQDIHGTSVTIEVSLTIGVPCIALVINEVPQLFPIRVFKEQVENAYQREVTAIIPHSEEVMAFGSAGVFAASYHQHPVTQVLRQLTTQLLSEMNSVRS